MSGNENYKKAAMLIGAFAILCLVAEVSGVYDVPFFSMSGGAGPQVPDPSVGGTGDTGFKTPKDFPNAIITTDIAAWDTLDISTARTIGTDINCLWFRYSGGWIKLASGDAADVSVTSSDNDAVYLAVQFPGSPSYYVDYQKILDMNQHLSWYGYEDITGDDIEEFIFKVSISGSTYAQSTGKWNMPLVNVYCLTYDSSFSIPSGGQPADITSVGTATTTKYLKWYTEVSAEKKGIAVYKVVVSVNTSDISVIALKKLNIPGVGYIDGSSFTQDVLTSSTKWTYTVCGNVLHGANYITRPVNDPNEHKFTAAVETNLAASTNYDVSLTLYELSPAEASLTDTDTVRLST